MITHCNWSLLKTTKCSLQQDRKWNCFSCKKQIIAYSSLRSLQCLISPSIYLYSVSDVCRVRSPNWGWNIMVLDYIMPLFLSGLQLMAPARFISTCVLCARVNSKECHALTGEVVWRIYAPCEMPARFTHSLCTLLSCDGCAKNV